MPRMGKTEEDWNGLKLGFLKTVQPNSFSKLISAVCNFKNNAQGTFVCLDFLLVSFTSNLFAYFKFHSDWGRVTGKIEQNELDCRDAAPTPASSVVSYAAVFVSFYFHTTRRQKKSYVGGYFLLLHSSCSLQRWLPGYSVTRLNQNPLLVH